MGCVAGFGGHPRGSDWVWSCLTLCPHHLSLHLFRLSWPFSVSISNTCSTTLSLFLSLLSLPHLAVSPWCYYFGLSPSLGLSVSASLPPLSLRVSLSPFSYLSPPLCLSASLYSLISACLSSCLFLPHLFSPLCHPHPCSGSSRAAPAPALCGPGGPGGRPGGGSGLAHVAELRTGADAAPSGHS